MDWVGLSRTVQTSREWTSCRKWSCHMRSRPAFNSNEKKHVSRITTRVYPYIRILPRYASTTGQKSSPDEDRPAGNIISVPSGDLVFLSRVRHRFQWTVAQSQAGVGEGIERQLTASPGGSCLVTSHSWTEFPSRPALAPDKANDGVLTSSTKSSAPAGKHINHFISGRSSSGLVESDCSLDDGQCPEGRAHTPHGPQSDACECFRKAVGNRTRG
ncbi:hypothetical protein BO78DRAFT_173600 [Aspergillus sclerotiicarbonarius CBS 121057]|uniref:Uncharacterized protein n=1 Tax=Aspergillus sclerotiicarbonarius (strain CBS 121057 / IBT 28362) TaxID=1448318 RepID=A0A319ET99_ASPSB|nr:hypothetical protein BO78DRAFT_173600 [Aspergillus sclerotiicarbonarius CBS 121057]